MKPFDCEDRFIHYSIEISNITDGVNNTRFGNHISGHLISSESSPALNYGEVHSAESKKEFIHKMKIIVKELKASRVCLKIIQSNPFVNDLKMLLAILKETEKLISIVYKSMKPQMLIC